MRKTSVYLTDDEAEGLRRAAAARDQSQAELIREGIRLVLESMGPPDREFRSMGKGSGGGSPYAPWDADELHRRRLGTREAKRRWP
jgi:hypothetical protein